MRRMGPPKRLLLRTRMSILVSFLVTGERKDSILGSVLQMSRMEVHSKIVSFIGGRFYLASQLPGGTLSASARIGRHAHHFSDNTCFHLSEISYIQQGHVCHFLTKNVPYLTSERGRDTGMVRGAASPKWPRKVLIWQRCVQTPF